MDVHDFRSMESGFQSLFLYYFDGIISLK